MRTILIFSIATLLLQSCSRNAYVPSVSNVPILSEKDDMNIGFALNYIQLSYALSNNVGIMFNADKHSYLRDPLQEVNTRKHNVELGGGYFRHIDDFITLQAYGGIAIGKVSFGGFNDIDSTSFSARQVKYFIMPSITFRHEYVNVSISARFTGLDYYNVNDSQYFFNSEHNNNFDLRLINSPFYTLFEPALTLRVGSDKVKMMLQLQHSFLLESRPLSRINRTLVLGFHLNLNTKKKVEKEKN